MSVERKRPDKPKPGRSKPSERKRKYSEPPLPKSVPSREVDINQHEERPDPMKERKDEREER